MNITKQKETHRHKELVVTNGEGQDRGKVLRDINYQDKTSETQGYSVQHKKYNQCFTITLNGM